MIETPKGLFEIRSAADLDRARKANVASASSRYGAEQQWLGTLAELRPFQGLIRLERWENAGYGTVGIGVLLLLANQFILREELLDKRQLIPVVVVAASVALLLTIWLFIAVGRSAGVGLFNRTLGKSALLLMIGVPLASYEGISLLNCSIGGGELIEHSTSIVSGEATESRSRRRGRTWSYHVRVASWREGEATIDLTVGEAAWKRLHVGDRVTVKSGKGLFGLEYALLPEGW